MLSFLVRLTNRAVVLLLGVPTKSSRADPGAIAHAVRVLKGAEATPMAHTDRSFRRVVLGAHGGEIVRGGSVLGKVPNPSIRFCEVKTSAKIFRNSDSLTYACDAKGGLAHAAPVAITGSSGFWRAFLAHYGGLVQNRAVFG